MSIPFIVYNKLAGKHDQNDNNVAKENTCDNVTEVSADVDNVGSTVMPNDVIVVNSDHGIVISSETGIVEENERYVGNNYPIENASEEIGLINYNCNTENAGCDRFENDNLKQMIYDGTLNENICHIYDDSSNQVDGEVIDLIEELTRRTVNANEMHSGDNMFEGDEEIPNFGKICIKRTTSLDKKNANNISFEKENHNTTELNTSPQIELTCSGNSSHDHENNICTLNKKKQNKDIEENLGMDILDNIISSDQDVIKDSNEISSRDMKKANDHEVITVIKGKPYFGPHISKTDYTNVENENQKHMEFDETDTYTENICDNNNNEINEGKNSNNDESSSKETGIFIQEDAVVNDLNEENIDDVFEEMITECSEDDFFSNVTNKTIDKGVCDIPYLSKSEIMIIFPQLKTSKGQIIYIVLNDEENLDEPLINVRSETHVNIPFKEHKPTRTLSTCSFEIPEQTFIMKGRFVSGLVSVEMKSLHGFEHNITKRQWCYILPNSEEPIVSKQWRYNAMVNKEPCQLSFTVIEDPTAIQRWETTTFELMNRTHERVQSESEWVLIDCTHKDIELFNAHQNEVSCRIDHDHQHINTPDKNCAVS